MLRKIISIVLSVAVLLSMATQITFADDHTVTLLPVADSIVRRDTSNQSDNYGTASPMLGYSGSNDNGGSRRLVYFAFDLSGVNIPEGKSVTSAKIKFYANNNSSVSNSQLVFWNVDEEWSETSINWKNQPLASKEVKDSENGYEKGFPSDPALIHDYDTSVGLKQYGLYEFEIGSLVRNYLLTEENENPFSFAMAARTTGDGVFATSYASKEDADSLLHPVLEITVSSLNSMLAVSSTPSDGSKNINVSDEIAIQFSNPIEKVTSSNINISGDNGNVNVDENAISVSDNVVSFSADFDAYTYYTVTISDVTDVYGQIQKFPYSISFSTASGAGEDTQSVAVCANTDITYNSDRDEIIVNSNAGKVNSGPGRFVLYKLDLTNLDKTKTLVDARFRFVSAASQTFTVKLYDVSDGTWMETADLAGNNEYYETLKSDTSDSANYVGDASFDGVGSAASVDITSVLNKAIANEETYVTLAIVYNSTRGFYRIENANADLRPCVTVAAEAPGFAVYSSVPDKGGVMIGIKTPIEMTVTTVLSPDCEQYVWLIDFNGNRIDADVVTDDTKLTVTPLSDLTDDTPYKIVLKAGVTDVYGNNLESDKVILSFYSGSALEISPIKYTYELSPLYDLTEECNAYIAGDSITAVSKIKNYSSESKTAIMFVIVFDENNKMVSIDYCGGVGSVDGDALETQFSKTITVPSDCTASHIKAFFWDGADLIRPLCPEAIIYQD